MSILTAKHLAAQKPKPMAKKKAPARKTQAERTAHSDSKMYEAAKQLICESGTHNTTLKEVGERAGFSRGLASSRFGSKENLFGNLVANFNEKWVEELARFLGGRTGLSAYLAALNAVEDFLLNEATDMKAMYILWYESISSHNELRNRLAEHHAVYRRDAERWIREGIAEGCIRSDVDPAAVAVQFCSFIFGTIYQWLVAPEAIDIPYHFDRYRHVVLETMSEPRSAGPRNGLNPHLLDESK
jgi:AcrR family transcriptional regulator